MSTWTWDYKSSELGQWSSYPTYNPTFICLRNFEYAAYWLWIRQDKTQEKHWPDFMALGHKEVKLFTSSIPTLKTLLHNKCNVSLPPLDFLAALQMRCKNIDTLLLGTPGILCSWALQGYFSVGPCRDIWWLDTAGILCRWALRGYLVVEHCRDTLRLGSVRILCGWALQGYSAAGHGRDTWWLGTAEILCGSALQGYSAVGHCRDTWWLGTAGIFCGSAHPLSIAGILIGWALQGYSVVGHCRDTWWLGTAGILGGWALQG